MATTQNTLEFAANNWRAVARMAYKGMIASLAGMLVMACSGCGGGGGGSTPEPVAKAPPKPVQISAAGDSTMLGLVYENGAYVQTGDTTAYLQTDLQAQFSSSVTVVLNARSGTTLENLLSGTGFPEDFAAYLAKDKSQIVIENFGLNEPGYGVTPEQFRQSLVQFVTMVRNAGKIPVLEEPNPNCVKGTTAVEYVYPTGLAVSQYVPVIDEVAITYSVPLISQYGKIKLLPDFCTLMSDGVQHPTPALYAIKAMNQTATLAPVVNALR